MSLPATNRDEITSRQSRNTATVLTFSSVTRQRNSFAAWFKSF
jgi:hypothetical protein